MIARDLAPVAPLPPPSVRAAWLAPIGLLLLVAAAAFLGVRRDALRLGWLLTWGASSAEMTLGLALVARAFPLRPAVAGVLYGLAAGLMADAGWRLFCHFSDPAHVFGAHIAAVAVSAALGALLAPRLRS